MRNTYNKDNQFQSERKKFNEKKHSLGKKFSQTSLSVEELMQAIQRSRQTTDTLPLEHEAESNEIITFNNLNISEGLKRNIATRNYTTLTPIQNKTIPHILLGRDIIGIANTGTGKTAAFLIPLINKIITNKSEKALILAPTRELALQIQDEFRSLAKGLGVYSVICIGGTSMKRQKMDLQRGANIVIGTPGRIKDMILGRNINLSLFTTVVLDEADRMVDIGFISDIKYFISLLPNQRQSLFFSATISGKVNEILNAFVKNPVTISVKQQETAVNIVQEVINIQSNQKKLDQLHNLLAQDGFEKVLIFGRTKWGVQKLTEQLIQRGFRAGVIHGNKRQNQRQRTLEQFKNDEIKILLATDVASRGLDIQDVSHVINYDMPATLDDYIHRIGRTGRANKKGIALTFIEKKSHYSSR